MFFLKLAEKTGRDLGYLYPNNSLLGGEGGGGISCKTNYLLYDCGLLRTN